MIRVFLVEDEIVVREGIKAGINWKENGFEFVGEASDGELAYPLIQELKPDIIITDIKMPFMDGLELSKLVKREMPQIKIVILSGYDEFEYAQKAITIGVTDYLIKPISGSRLIEAINQVGDIIRKEKQQQEYYEKFQQEMAENEQIERYKFFQNLVSSKPSYAELIEKGKKIGIDLGAQAYQIILFKIFMNENDSDAYSEYKIEAEREIEGIIQQEGQMILFNRMTEGSALLVMGTDKGQLEKRVAKCLEQVNTVLERFSDLTYFAGVGSVEYRLSGLNKSFEGASKAFSYRYLINKNQIVFSENMNEYQLPKEVDIDFQSIDIAKMDKRIIENFLRNGSSNEIHHFVEEFFRSIGESNFNSLLFRQYIAMDIYFVTVAFMEQMGYSAGRAGKEYEAFQEMTGILASVSSTKKYLEELFSKALELRNESSEKRYNIILDNAKEYIMKHYNDEEISLNTVAASVDISPSHFSTIFSQETGSTFIEFLTGVRIEKAKELLRCSNFKMAEIGYEVGYKDSHYFSFLFKKVQGISPKDYRMRMKE